MNNNNNNVRNRLLSEYPRDKDGSWRILGEDPNCDWGGHHHQPDLGTYQGRYEDIVDYALNLEGFFTWGAGGDIREVVMRKITPDVLKETRKINKELEELEKQKKKLTERLEYLNNLRET